jgi:hypothetical protein
VSAESSRPVLFHFVISTERSAVERPAVPTAALPSTLSSRPKRSAVEGPAVIFTNSGLSKDPTEVYAETAEIDDVWIIERSGRKTTPEAKKIPRWNNTGQADWRFEVEGVIVWVPFRSHYFRITGARGLPCTPFIRTRNVHRERASYLTPAARSLLRAGQTCNFPKG